MQRPWKYYRRLVRNVQQDSKQAVRGYISVDAPVATQSFCLVNVGQSQAQKQLGQILVTRYVTAFGRW
jgi:hypothetical protein